jgi:hypothetical protein
VAPVAALIKTTLGFKKIIFLHKMPFIVTLGGSKLDSCKTYYCEKYINLRNLFVTCWQNLGKISCGEK